MSELFVDTPAWPVLRVLGPDAKTWLNGIVTCDVTRVGPEGGAWGLLLSKTGKIQAELQIVEAEGGLEIGVSGGEVEAVHDALEKYLVMEDAELSRVPERRFVCVYGPGAVACARQLSRAASSMPWIPSPGGAEGAAFVVDEAELPSVLDAARAHGSLIEEESRERLFVSWGIPRFDVDFSSKDNPHEAGLERRTVSWSKGCYLGQEVVCMQDMRGKVKRRVVRLRGEGVPFARGVPVASGDAVVGHVTSSGGSEEAWASVHAPHFEPGTELSVEGRPVRVDALSS